MKTCVDCGCDLPTPLDEFGDIGEERCQTHWLEYQHNTPFRLADAAQERIDELEGRNEDLQIRIDASYSEEDDVTNDWNVWDEWIAEIETNEIEILELQKVIENADFLALFDPQGAHQTCLTKTIA